VVLRRSTLPPETKTGRSSAGSIGHDSGMAADERPPRNDPQATVRQLEIGVQSQKGRKLRFNGLCNQPPRARTQDFRERVVDFVFVAALDGLAIPPESAFQG
jgi:hypothetical protein